MTECRSRPSDSDADAATARERRLEPLVQAGQAGICRGLLAADSNLSEVCTDFDKVEGMMLGVAVGDALGNTSESLSPHVRRGRYGEIRDYLPNRHANGRAIGLPSDDSQLAFWTLEQMLEDGELRPERVAARFCESRIFGIGSAVSEFVVNFRSGRPWFASGSRSAGNGALMRIAPVVIPHIRTQLADLYVDAALLALITHNDAASISSCVAFAGLLRRLLAMNSVPDPEWWLQTYVDVAGSLEGDTH